ncbi:uncharacterized protein FA14DRAFT_161400 [Meira miltonrushii]|uniref:GDP/GTP exchange factor Sec2 N-terminal domain-containing protein n=1 Tax=Meira miltonrushii TaxID=1280837 RepID=A0A316V821_9BASI|nr:uncharacterized protein FA14DRAFT_161400 [Meira miltonrushii]PWN33650.1 hypothetical protein FA14DRAFT_161400 [Meira miltonrushii]
MSSMSSRRNPVDVNASSFDVGADKIPTSDIIRPSPDAILADEADPDTLLGMESDSEAGGSRPVSALFDAGGGKRKSKRISKQMQDVSLEPPSANTVTQNDPTPKTSTFLGHETPSHSTAQSIEFAANPNDLKEQVTELTTQVTGLNNKLVTSFVRIGDLEDDLSEMQDMVANYKKQIASLEKERQEHLAALNTGLLVEKEHVSSEMQKMMERLVQETAEKGKAVDERQKIESELDELSSSLFSEANKMVAVERLARARAEEKSKSMEERLKDTEEIVGEQQKRLVELQALVEKNERKSASETPHSQDSFDERQNESIHSTGLLSKPSGNHDHALLLPANNGFLRLDIIPYVELRSFLNHLRRLRLQLAPFYNFPVHDVTPSTEETPIASRTGSPAPHQFGPSGVNPFQASPFLAAGVSRHRDFPTLPANVEQLIYIPNQLSSLTFLKRFNEEDCEPCLGLDHAPGLNWLSKRQMRTAIVDGSFMIEPIFGGGIYDEEDVRMKAVGTPPAACAMCGKAVVNVPLPGGGNLSDASGWMNAASSLQASVNAMASSLPVRDLTASPPPQGSGRGSETPKDLTKNRTSIFNTLRNISGGKSNAATEKPTVVTPTTENPSWHSQTVGVVEDEFAARPPAIPTHIFRISETSSARYLICPDYCLKRIRAICDFWGYVRNLERAVVLEGKLAWDDELDTEDEPAPRLPTKDFDLNKGGLVEKDSQIIEKKGDEAEVEAVEEAKADDDSKVSDEKLTAEAESEKSKDSLDEEANTQESRKVSASHTASDVEDEHDFADAKSQHSSDEEEQSPITDTRDSIDKKDADTITVNEGKETVDTSISAVESTETSDKKSSTDALDIPTQDETPVPSPLPKSANPANGPPALPKTARPVPKLPDNNNTPPALPPRRVRTPAAEVFQPIDLGPEPRRLLPIKNAEKPIWEEKVWLEVNRLRADMWSARIGAQADERRMA